jgi:hypothetical protein
MAKQISLIPFTGKLGHLIGYERNGKYFLRSMPEIVHQTTATRRAAQRFGIASRKAALVRNAFYGELDIRCDSGYANRLNKVLIAAAGNHTAITGFRFNEYAGIDRFFTVPPRLFKNGVLHIPAQHIAQYKDITALEVKVMAARIDFKTRRVSDTEAAVLIIDPSIPFSGADVPMDVPGSGTLVVSLQVRSMHKEALSNSRQYQAADIIAVMEPQIPVCNSKPTYPQQMPSQAANCPNSKEAQALLPIIQRE